VDSRALFWRAKAACERAYAPYSGFRVGAAVLTASGEVFEGANIENASYGATICAERVAVSKTVSEGHKDSIAAIAIASSGADAAFPCGICRQFIFEFGDDIRIIVGTDEARLEEYTISELLPNGFRL
jgi:cytidine deaminase